eukprot:TRINITY_DN18240_c0_g2_i2.p1 TRINITY_DN18240_c0_g2~~TRINITY_DN18240_c0_g2_i2.p1  ORF type:complete len:330 (-),score=42.77 TRINITY_DN18240_c0_g2_i2:1313-2302(-)
MVRAVLSASLLRRACAPLVASRTSASGLGPCCASYHKNVVDHYNNLRNVGSFDKADPVVNTALVGALDCRDVMKLKIRVDETGKTLDSCFKTFVCLSAIAWSSVGRGSSGDLRARSARCGCQAKAEGSSGVAAPVEGSQAFHGGEALEWGPDVDDVQASRGQGDAGPGLSAAGGGASASALHCNLALASLSTAFWSSSSLTLLRQLPGRAMAALQRTQLAQMLFRLLIRGPYGIVLLLGCVLTAVVTSLWRHFKEADEIWNSLPCELCDCRGIEQCHVCQGRGEILWEGKLYHTNPCPRCLGKKTIKCRRCEGQCLRKKAGKAARGGQS